MKMCVTPSPCEKRRFKVIRYRSSNGCQFLLFFFVALSVSFSMTMRTSDCKKNERETEERAKVTAAEKNCIKKATKTRSNKSAISSQAWYLHTSRACVFFSSSCVCVFTAFSYRLGCCNYHIAAHIFLFHCFDSHSTLPSIDSVSIICCLFLRRLQMPWLSFNLQKVYIYILLSARGTQRVVIIRHLWEEEKKWIVKRNTSKWNEPFWNVIFETFCLHI